MAIFVVYLIFAAIIGAIAAGKGRSFLGWTLIGCIVTPLLAIILVAVISPANRSDRRSEDAYRRHGAKECPDCSETVLGDALVCKHCGYRFDLYGNLGTHGFERIQSTREAQAIALRAIAEADGPLEPWQMANIVDYVIGQTNGRDVSRETRHTLAEWIYELPRERGSLGSAVRALRSLSRGDRKRFLRAAQKVARRRSERAIAFREKIEQAIS